MFDANLTLEKALESIDDGTPMATLDAPIDQDTIALYRTASDLRNQCFQDADSYRAQYPLLQQHIAELGKRFCTLEPFHFIVQRARIYLDQIDPSWQLSVAMMTGSFLEEAFSNAAAVSNNVRVRMHVTSKGLLIDVDQGAEEIPASFIDDVRKKSQYVLEELSKGKSLDMFIRENREIMLRAVGYVPPNTGVKDISPYRGNGVSNLVINDLFRLNYVTNGSGNSTLALSTQNQVADAMLFKQGDRSVVSRLYGPSEVPINVADVDDIFGGGFDIKDLMN